MRLLLNGDDLARLAKEKEPDEGVGDIDLAQAYPWPTEGTWTRVTMLRALDGGVAGPDGRSRSISSDIDREVLGEVRRLADAIVVGATTVRQEPYGPLKADPDAAAERTALGLSEAPVMVIVSGSLDLPWSEDMFAQSFHTPIVATTEAAPDDAKEEARKHAELLVLPGDDLKAADLVAALHQRGLTRLVCEGGPGLLTAFAADDVIDEVDLTVAPVMPTTVIESSPGDLEAVPGFSLAGLLLHDSFLFARYTRDREHDVDAADEDAS
ncbi:dihydrofolate reductase family protein [Nocardioides sp.]|uniref:dihydrofolate reductase family protein n=1 Tax=Nocardioides sp. TaxID=35761 RepID=UPI00286D05B1|nr:dihydrofolate reductase family protein [Nocardioides sp.]